MESSPYISLIFVNYHSAWQLSLALKSLYSLEKNRNFEVIVINNDLEETTALEELQKLCPITLLHNTTNRGFAAAANQGAKSARGILLGFINPDTCWSKESLSQVAELFLYNKNLGVFGMTLIDENNQYEPWSGGVFPTLLGLLKNNLVPRAFRRASEETGPFQWVSGGGLFIRRALFEKLRGFDEDFFLYYEDVDLCFRTHEMGYEVCRDPFVPLKHAGGKSSPSRDLQKKYFYASQKVYFRKHRPLYERAALYFLHILFRKF